MPPQGIEEIMVIGRLKLALTYFIIAFIFIVCSGCGLALDLNKGSLLGAANIEGTGGTRSDGNNFGQIYSVSTVVAAPVAAIPGWVQSDFPFTGNPVLIGQAVTDGQTQFRFNYTYPPNNYQLANAHLVIDTSRDSSDTEGIFVDGVFSGRPPGGMVNMTSTKITHSTYYQGNYPTPGDKNTYYIDWSVSHYKQATRNTFDLNVEDLLLQTPLTTVSLLNDGVFNVVTGDDSPVYQGYLVMNGYTISPTALTCVNSPTYTFQNVFVHMDGNTIAQSAFTGTVRNPRDSWTLAPDPFQSVEWNYDAALPRVQTTNINVTLATISMQVRRAASGQAALVVNGVGVAQAGFNSSLATSAVEEWLTDAPTVTAWTNFVTSIPGNNNPTTVTLNLRNILGATRMRTLLAQGKLNISIAGSIYAVNSAGFANATTRVYGSPAVSGPELNLQGTYFTQLCDVPNNPDSPITDGGALPGDCQTDGTSPLITSLDAVEITDAGATIQWLTDEAATDRTQYGIASPDTLTAADASADKTFHRVTLTGLLPYKYYQYQAVSTDSCGNTTISPVKLFRTLR
jgi:hypothetical protein